MWNRNKVNKTYVTHIHTHTHTHTYTPTISCIKTLGPTHGLFIKPEKSKSVQVPGVLEEATRATTAPLECNHGE